MRISHSIKMKIQKKNLRKQNLIQLKNYQREVSLKVQLLLR